ncbi:MAG: type III pantothenate kinase [Owenweeksia sp.]|nr:type III pantothenate kinase [Owenweeksia sp.]
MHRPLPFKLKYKTPETLGLDRIALAAAAAHDYPGKNCLVIDAGTCLTYDFIDRERNYHGGAIAPGLKMRYQALHHFTARLPLVAHRAEVELIGDSTETSIQAGVAGGIFYEVKATIEAYQMRYPGLITVLTGGDYAAFEGLSKNGIFAAPEFLLHGLNNILEYYAEVL